MSSLKILPKADEGKYTSRRIVEESKLKCKKWKFYSLKKMFELQVWGVSFTTILTVASNFSTIFGQEVNPYSSRAKSITILSPNSPYISVQFI